MVPPKGKGKAAPATARETRAAAQQDRQWAKASDWEEHRERITDLYRNQGLYLDEVMAIMSRDYDFHANHRMYKTRIKKWGIDKNQKATEVALMLRLKRERDAQGKASQFIVRGRVVDWAKIQAYLRREPLLVRKLQAAADGSGGMEVVLGSAAAGIICRTPSPDPAEIEVPHPVQETLAMRLPEEIAVLTRDYFRGALETGVWRRVGGNEPPILGDTMGDTGGDGGEDIRPGQGVLYLPRKPTAGDDLENWSHRVRRARYMILTPSGVDEGFRRLGECLDGTRELVADQDPLMLYNLLGHTIGLTPNGRDLGAALCRHFRELSEIILGQGHPVPAIFARFEAVVNTDAHYESIGVPIRCLMDIFEEAEGGARQDVMDMYRRLVWLLRLPPASQEKPPDGGMALKDLVDRFQKMRNTGGSLRFTHAYMAYVSALAVKVKGSGSSAGSSPSSEGGKSAGGEENNVIKFRDSKHFLIFNIEGAKPSQFETDKEEDDDADADADADADEG